MSNLEISKELKRLSSEISEYVDNYNDDEASCILFLIERYLDEKRWTSCQIKEINDLIVDANKFISSN